MARQQSSLRNIYKINSKRLRKSNWNLNITSDRARGNGELISLADSTTLRMIRSIRGVADNEDKIKNIKRTIRLLKKEKKTTDIKKEIKRQYAELDKELMMDDYICIVIDSNKDYDRANKGFFINGKRYTRLLATTGGVKASVIVYVATDIHNELLSRLENNINKSIPLVPAKYQAYLSLACSSSALVSNTRKVLVVKDAEVKFKSDITMIDDTESDLPVVQEINDYEIDFESSDGCAMISPSLSNKWARDLGLDYTPSGYCIRNAYCKGMVFTFDYVEFADRIAKTNKITDVWGEEHDIRDIELILTTSMLKLWNSYSSIGNYLDCCEVNGHRFSVTKAMPRELDNERRLNYQFIQALELSDNDIYELINPTIRELKEVISGDYRKSLLFLRGMDLNERNAHNASAEYITALMANKEMIRDPFVQKSIHSMIKTKIDEAKFGKIKVSGNFSIIADDPYTLCQSMFGLEVTGLLKAGEFYSRYWIDRGVDKVAGFRAPMTCQSNARIVRIVSNEDMNHWYRYMPTVTIFNSWDTTCHALNGADKDGDTMFTTDNEIMVNGVVELNAIVCAQKNAKKIKVTEKDIIQSDKNSFGDEIGSITNRVTTMYERASLFDKDSAEYKELMYRIQCGQNYQQNSIDKAKGIVSKPMPKAWYDYKANEVRVDKNTGEILDDEETVARKLFNQNILASKKPYFMNYIYDIQKRKHKKFIDNTNKKCLMEFKMTVDELRLKRYHTEKEKEFLQWYDIKNPVGVAPCIMNKICWTVENEFSDISFKINNSQFDYSIIKSGVKTSKALVKKIEKLYTEYKSQVKQYKKQIKTNIVSKEEKVNNYNMLKEYFKKRALEICPNEKELCDIIIDMCYSKSNDKQFVWDIVGDVIVDNLLERNNWMIEYPERDEGGDVLFNGHRFSMRQISVKNEMGE